MRLPGEVSAVFKVKIRDRQIELCFINIYFISQSNDSLIMGLVIRSVFIGICYF